MKAGSRLRSGLLRLIDAIASCLPLVAFQRGARYLASRLDVTVARLLAGLGSKLEVVVVAVFAISVLPFRLTFTANFSVARAPLAKSPTFHTTVPPAPTGGALEGAGDALANVVPCGTASLTNTPLAEFGPRLLTIIV